VIIKAQLLREILEQEWATVTDLRGRQCKLAVKPAADQIIADRSAPAA
jgi:hypothetical protein